MYIMWSYVRSITLIRFRLVPGCHQCWLTMARVLCVCPHSFSHSVWVGAALPSMQIGKLWHIKTSLSQSHTDIVGVP